MLVVGRNPGEYVVIGDGIMVRVVKSNDGDLRLAIEAPKDLPIWRGELYEELFPSKDAASSQAAERKPKR
ncbi:carbon storage regulator [Paenibacillus mesophilus]|uniref:carbon storage regulator n=1 Tax=Paenibacillus mesophilus TaxID=2582849 RepID=UPI00110F4BDC|nr:carbon storage regulator [Paenibacillus mesophilus]TMV43680.1 carbon storage regulator [Paenibacillus mesophilus]